eukprot:237434-Pleurochrysis_carterae.AAC.1
MEKAADAPAFNAKQEAAWRLHHEIRPSFRLSSFCRLNASNAAVKRIARSQKLKSCPAQG